MRAMCAKECYLSPNEGMAVFRRKLEDIEDLCSNLNGNIIVADDFNAKSCKWGMSWTETRGRDVTEGDLLKETLP